MLRIRSEQFAPFQTVTDTLFTNKLTAYIRKHHGEDVVKLPTGVFLVKDLSEETLQTLIASIIHPAGETGWTPKNIERLSQAFTDTKTPATKT